MKCPGLFEVATFVWISSGLVGPGCAPGQRAEDDSRGAQQQHVQPSLMQTEPIDVSEPSDATTNHLKHIHERICAAIAFGRFTIASDYDRTLVAPNHVDLAASIRTTIHGV